MAWGMLIRFADFICGSNNFSIDNMNIVQLSHKTFYYFPFTYLPPIYHLQLLLKCQYNDILTTFSSIAQTTNWLIEEWRLNLGKSWFSQIYYSTSKSSDNKLTTSWLSIFQAERTENKLKWHFNYTLFSLTIMELLRFLIYRFIKALRRNSRRNERGRVEWQPRKWHLTLSLDW